MRRRNSSRRPTRRNRRVRRTGRARRGNTSRMRTPRPGRIGYRL